MESNPMTFDKFVEVMRAADISPEEFLNLTDGEAPEDMYEHEPLEPGKYYAKPKVDDNGDYIMKPEWTAKEEVFKSLGEVKQVAQKGGEDQGSEYYQVFSVGDFLVKIEGYYTSYDGNDYDSAEFEQVRALQKTVTVYE